MYLFDTDGESFVLLCELTIDVTKDNKYSVTHRAPGGCRGYLIMGEYSTLERAQLELYRVYEAVLTDKKVYQFVKEKEE